MSRLLNNSEFSKSFSEEETLSLRKILVELSPLVEKLNISGFENKVPDASVRIRALELTNALESYFGLDDENLRFGFDKGVS